MRTGMAEVVDGLENVPAHGLRNEWAREPIGDIDNELLVANIDLPEAKPGPGFLGQALKLWVQGLLRGHLNQIDVNVLDC